MPNFEETNNILHSEADNDTMISNAQRSAKIDEYDGLLHSIMVSTASSPFSLGIGN